MLEYFIEKSSAHDVSAVTLNNFYFLSQPISNGFNYRIPIEANDDNDTVVGNIWFFGTGRWNCLEQIGRDCIRRDQIEWFKHESRKMDDNDKFR